MTVKRKRMTARRMKSTSSTIESTAKANDLLGGRKIERVYLNRVREEDGSESSGYPVFVLDDNSEITFSVQDYGSGTYGVDLIRRAK